MAGDQPPPELAPQEPIEEEHEPQIGYVPQLRGMRISELRENELPLTLEERPTALLKDAEERKRRWWLAWSLLAVSVGLTLIVIGIALWGSDDAWTRASAQVGFLLTPFHTLMGIAIGFYFAENRRSS